MKHRKGAEDAKSTGDQIPAEVTERCMVDFLYFALYAARRRKWLWVITNCEAAVLFARDLEKAERKKGAGR